MSVPRVQIIPSKGYFEVDNQKIWKQIKQFHCFSSLEQYFQQTCLKYNYLPNGGCQSTKFLRFLYLISYPSLTLGTLRFFVLFFSHITGYHDFNFAIYLADFSWFMGAASFWFMLVCACWSTVALLSRSYSEYSNTRLDLQFWINPLKILENPETQSDSKIQSAIHLVLIVLRFNLISGSLCAFAVSLPILIGFPGRYFLSTLLALIYTAFHGYLVVSYEVNFTVIIAFYLYVYGRRYHVLAQSAQKFISYAKKTKSTHSHTGFEKHFKSQLIVWTKEMEKCNKFLSIINNIIFCGTFLAEIFVLYLVFFVETEGAPKYVIQFLGFLTLLYGQTIFFIFGTYVQRQYDQCLSQLNCLMEFQAIYRVSFYHQLKCLITAEYLVDRKIFIVFAGISTETINFIKVQVEMAMLLLLLLANVGRSSIP